LDEPTEGLVPVVIADLVESIRKVAASGIASMLVEQNAKLPAQLARFYVLDAGRVVWSGSKAEFDHAKQTIDRLLSV
jgi:branched-chain amino acid transport system ATP-binding protein